MSDTLKYWYLRDHKLFQVLKNEQIKQLCIITGFKKAKHNEIIRLSEIEEPRIFLLKKGRIKLTVTDEAGNESVEDLLERGDLFGVLTLEPDTTYTTEAKVLSDEVLICSFTVADFENLLLKYPELALSYTKFVGFKMRRIRNSYQNLMRKDAKSRLLYFLNDWSEKDGVKTGSTVTLENFLTQADISQIICSSRQTAVQLLSELENTGVITYNRKEITFPNYADFKKLVASVG